MRSIEAILAEKDRAGRLTLLCSDGTRLRVQPSVISDLGLCKGMELPDAALEAIRETQARAETRARAVRIMTATSISEQALQRRLVQKGETEAHAADAVAWLSDLHLLNDAETARQIVRRAAGKGYGRARIRQELRHKGIPEALWDEALEELPEPDDAIDRFLDQRLHGSEPDQKELRRVTDALLRRGHRWDDIRSALSRYRERMEEDE